MLRSRIDKLCRIVLAVVCLAALAPVCLAQETDEFDPISAGAEIDALRERLDAADEPDTGFLAEARAVALDITASADACAEQAAEARERLEARYEPLRDVDADVAPAVFDQRNQIRNQLDEAIARETACIGVSDGATALLETIAETQSALSQRFLSYRGRNAFTAVRDFALRVDELPARLRALPRLDLAPGMTPVFLLWLLAGGGVLATAIGLFLRYRFYAWYEADGGDDAPPKLRHLFPKPLADQAPTLLSGVTFLVVLAAALAEPSLDPAIVRVALGILLFGLGCAVVDWATGPLSPAADVQGMVPRHVRPLRHRLKWLIFALVLSFVLLGRNWLSIRLIDPAVTGRSAMIFLVAAMLLWVFLYLGRIPGLRNRFRLVRYLAVLTLLVAIVAVLIGYQNFAGYLVHGVTRTSLALFLIWILLWLIAKTFDYLIQQDTLPATRLRKTLGVGKQGSRTALGFMQLAADLVLWIGLAVYLIYVWDESGTTLERLVELVRLGGQVGNMRIVPADIIIGILIFVALLIVIGWMKRWIDRRWLQHIVAERGAREALVTLFGYIGFVIAVLIGLSQAGVDLTGIALVSGGLALGIGLGMQEIANNFVSGLILLFERPIRTGDFVTVGNIEGFVRRISIRATEIETLDNQNVLVPNSELVSGRVTNWVLHDPQGRLRVVVGVAYGSDVEKVRDILERVANEHPEVITDGRAPAPRALFMGFGDSSLDFELRCRINRIDRRFSVISDLNFAIDNAFRAEGVTVPFPQRDLHIVSYPEHKPAAPEGPSDDEVTAPAPVHTSVVTRSHRETRRVVAPIERVWSALTDIEQLGRWAGADGRFSPHIGGTYDLTFADGTRHYGRIDIFIPPYRMRLVESPQDGEEPLPTGPITLEFLLREEEGNTLLTFDLEGIPATEDWEQDYNRAVTLWQNALAELEDLLSED